MEPLQLESIPKKKHTKGLGFAPLRLCGLDYQEKLEITHPASTNEQQKQRHYSIDSNEWEWGSNKSSSDYELTKTFREPGEPTKEKKFRELFRVGQIKTSISTSQEKQGSGEPWIKTFWDLEASTS